MNRFVIALAILLGCAAATLNAAGISLSNLTAGVAIGGGDLFYDVQSAGTGGVKVTGTQLKTFMSSSPTFTGTSTFTGTAAFADNGTWSATGIVVKGSANFADGGTWTANGITANSTATFADGGTWSQTGITVRTATLSGITSTQCLQVSTSGVVSGTAALCGSGGGGGATPGGSNAQVQFNNSGAFAGDSSFTFVTPGQISLALGSTNSNLKGINITETWNNSGLVFDAPIFLNVNNAFSATGSALMDLQINSATMYSMLKTVTGNGFGTYNPVNTAANGFGITNISAATFVIDGTSIPNTSYLNEIMVSSGHVWHMGVGQAGETALGVANKLYIYDRDGGAVRLLFVPTPSGGATILIPSDGGLAFTSAPGTGTIGSYDTALFRTAAGQLSLHAGLLTNAAGFDIYNTSDVGLGAPTNYERAAFDWTTSVNTLTIGSQSNGTGLGRVVMLVASGTKAISLSPTINIYGQSNPGANETYAVCAGSGATSLTAGGQLFVDTTACLASSMLVKHNIAAFNDYGMTKLASIAEPLHARNRLATAPIEIDPIAEAMALVPAVATYDTLGSGGPEFTLIAQNVCQVDERLCERTRSGEIRTFKPNSVISILVAAIQKQQSEIEELKRRLH